MPKLPSMLTSRPVRARKGSKWRSLFAGAVLGQFGAIGQGVAAATGLTARVKLDNAKVSASDKNKNKKPRVPRDPQQDMDAADDAGRRVSAAFHQAADAISDVSSDITKEARNLEQAISEAALRMKPTATPEMMPEAAEQGAKPTGGGMFFPGMFSLAKRALPWLLRRLLPLSVIGGGIMAANKIGADRQKLRDQDAEGMDPEAADAMKNSGNPLTFGLHALDRLRKRFGSGSPKGVSLDKYSIHALDTMTFKARWIEFKGASGVGGGSRTAEGPDSKTWAGRVYEMLGGSAMKKWVGSGMPSKPDAAGGGGGPKASGGKFQGNNPSRGYTTEKGAKGEFNYSLTSEGKQEMGLTPGGVAPASQLTTITAPNGQKVVVNKAAAQQNKEFLDHLAKGGYKINEVQGFANRSNVNAPGQVSTHASGGTMDINPGANPNKGGSTDMPKNIEDIAALHGKSSGHKFGDPMHFEQMSPKVWRDKLDDMVNRKVITPETRDYINKNHSVPDELFGPNHTIVSDFKLGANQTPAARAPDASPADVKQAEQEQYGRAMERNPFGIKPAPAAPPVVVPRDPLSADFSDWGKPETPRKADTHVFIKEQTAKTSQNADDAQKSDKDDDSYDDGPTLKQQVGADSYGGQ